MENDVYLEKLEKDLNDPKVEKYIREVFDEKKEEVEDKEKK